MRQTARCRVARRDWLLALVAGLLAVPAGALTPGSPEGLLAQKEFFLPELYISTANVPLAEVIDQLPNRAAWVAAGRTRAADGSAFQVFIDPRSGAATNLLGAVPLLPGNGVGNRVTLDTLSRRVGRRLAAVDAAVVRDAVLAHVRAHGELIGIDVEQLGEVSAAQVTPDLWQISIPQRYRGVPVRFGRVAATISHGNLVGVGTEAWGNVTLPDVEPVVSPEQAVEDGFAHVEGRSSEDEVLREPSLEIVPLAPPEHQAGERFAGPIGRGYGHRLVWTFVFQRSPEQAHWEVMVDARSGRVMALQDTNHYAQRQIRGGVYPVTNTGVCPNPAKCGRMSGFWPMPFANTGFPAPNEFTNSAGIYDYIGGTVTTSLSGRYVRIKDFCVPFGGGGISESSTTGALELGGVNGQHDCASAGASGGDTSASRTTFYEANRMAEIGRGYLPGNAWVRATLPADVNVPYVSTPGPLFCNAFWDNVNGHVGFYGSGDGCRNTGEVASIVDHEWGHGLDDNDAIGAMSNSSEGYADIAAIYRTQDSCIGHGTFDTFDWGCGRSADGAGYNVDEDQRGGASNPLHCATDCSGVRDADWRKHSDQVPDTPQNHVCVRCNQAFSGPGPCGRQTHCAAAPQRQAAWDLVALDLVSAPFNLDSQSAFIVGNRLFFQGSGNIGDWYSCACPSSANGCAMASGYMQWLFADDDNGSLNDGTPHMSAIFNAFNRHGIACGQPAVVNGGCAGGPQAAPGLTVTPGVFQNALSWNGVAAAARYRVFRTEGHAGCNYGKAQIAEVTGTSYVDTEVATGRAYYYNVMAAGASSACFSRASNCAQGTPIGSFNVSCTPSSLTIGGGAGSATSSCTVQSTGGFTSVVNLGCVGLPSGASCSLSPSSVTPLPGGAAHSTLTVTRGVLWPPGSVSFKVRGTTPSIPFGFHDAQLTLTLGSGPGSDLIASFDPVLRAPSCGATVGRSCDTRTLVRGRAHLGPEPNQPNTIGDRCADGTAGEGSNDRIVVTSADGASFAPGMGVTIEATVFARSDFSQDAADFFFAADADDPTWEYIGTEVPTAPGVQTLSVVYRLPPGGRQAVRVQFRNQGAPDACSAGPFDDRDDLVFAVGN